MRLMAGSTADCPVCGAVVWDSEAHAVWHENVSAWITDLAASPTTPPPFIPGSRSWPKHLTMWRLPARPDPDPVTAPIVEEP